MFAISSTILSQLSLQSVIDYDDAVDDDDDDDDDDEDEDDDGDVATVIYVLLAQQFRKINITACHVITQ